MGIFDAFTTTNADNAASAQIAGLNAGNTAATGNINQGIGAINTGYSAALQPFTQNYNTATQGTTALSNALGLNGQAGDASAISAAYASNPSYQFQLQQGNQNVLRNQAQSGQLASGATNLDLQAQGQGLANSTYQQYVQNLQPFLGASQTAASGVAGVNTGQANALAGQYGSLAGLNYQTQTGIGNANANADLAGNTASANALSAIMGGLGAVTGGAGGLSSGLGSFASSLSPYLQGATPTAVNGGVYPQYA